MLQKISPRFQHHAVYLAHWARLYLRQLFPPVVVAIVGPSCRAWSLELQQHLLGKARLVGTEASSALPWLAHKPALEGKTTIYVCHEGVCLAPTHSVAEALEQVRQVSSYS